MTQSLKSFQNLQQFTDITRFKSLEGKTINYDAPSHTHHATGSAGSACVACHMPQTVYMQVDKRRDHAFKVPNPELTIKYGIPNACNRCHQDKSATWAKERILQWYGRLYQNSPVLHHDSAHLTAIYFDKTQPDIFRASALILMIPMDKMGVYALLSALHAPSSIVKHAAVDRLSQFDLDFSRPYLQPLLSDDNRVVRASVARILAGSGIDSEAFNQALKEYQQMQQGNIDQPESLINLAQLAYQRGDTKKAIQYLKQGLKRDKHFIPLYVLLARLYAQNNDHAVAVKMVTQGIHHNPKVAQLHYVLALLYANRKDYENAKRALEKTVALDPNYPGAQRNLQGVEKKLQAT